MKKLCVAAAIAALAFVATPSNASASAFSQCPGVQLNPNGCQFLLTYNADGTLSLAVATGTDNQPYDGVEDTLIGVQNNTSAPVLSLTLGPAVGIFGLGPFGFDGDGACAAIACGNNDAAAFGYGGLVRNAAGANVGNVTFTNIQSVNVFADKGTVVFGANGIPAGGSAWFSLEDSFTVQTFPTGTPEPASLVLLGTGVLALARRLRKA